MLVADNNEQMNGVREYKFNDADDALRFCILFKGKIDAYSYREISGKTIHTYIVHL